MQNSEVSINDVIEMFNKLKPDDKKKCIAKMYYTYKHSEKAINKEEINKEEINNENREIEFGGCEPINAFSNKHEYIFTVSYGKISQEKFDKLNQWIAENLAFSGCDFPYNSRRCNYITCDSHYINDAKLIELMKSFIQTFPGSSCEKVYNKKDFRLSIPKTPSNIDYDPFNED
jgi:hypothetical protein